MVDPSAETLSDAALLVVFRRINTNGSGRIDVAEFRHAFAEAGLEVTMNDIIAVIAENDPDGEGSVDFENFLRGVISGGPDGVDQNLALLVRRLAATATIGQ